MTTATRRRRRPRRRCRRRRRRQRRCYRRRRRHRPRCPPPHRRRQRPPPAPPPPPTRTPPAARISRPRIARSAREPGTRASRPNTLATSQDVIQLQTGARAKAWCLLTCVEASRPWMRPIGRFRFIAWVKCPYRLVGKGSALRAGKRAPD